jgi:hypothetical protein
MLDITLLESRKEFFILVLRRKRDKKHPKHHCAVA